jgi:mRNA interferase RelE/StbE
MYALDVLPQAQHDLAQLDPPLRKRIGKRIDWLVEHVNDIKHESLSGEWARFLKFRVGDYRIVYKIAHAEKLIVIYRVRHRREVYD